MPSTQNQPQEQHDKAGCLHEVRLGSEDKVREEELEVRDKARDVTFPVEIELPKREAVAPRTHKPPMRPELGKDEGNDEARWRPPRSCSCRPATHQRHLHQREQHHHHAHDKARASMRENRHKSKLERKWLEPDFQKRPIIR